MDLEKKKAGDEFFVIYNNPHTPVVSSIQAAELVQHPKDPDALALFLYDTFHVIEDDDAIFSTLEEAESAYTDLFGEEF